MPYVNVGLKTVPNPDHYFLTINFHTIFSSITKSLTLRVAALTLNMLAPTTVGARINP